MAAVLYVDDEPTIRRAVELWLRRYGITVHAAAGVRDARALIAAQAAGGERLRGAFIDLWLEDGSGVELHDWLRAEHPALARHTAFVTGDTAAETAALRRARATGCPVLTKPFDLDALKRVAERWVLGGTGRKTGNGESRPENRE